ncbi:MAG: S1 RNA-binding domain-containing protein [Planctomycetota bacterium]
MTAQPNDTATPSTSPETQAHAEAPAKTHAAASSDANPQVPAAEQPSDPIAPPASSEDDAAVAARVEGGLEPIGPSVAPAHTPFQDAPVPDQASSSSESSPEPSSDAESQQSADAAVDDQVQAELAAAMGQLAAAGLTQAPKTDGDTKPNTPPTLPPRGDTAPATKPAIRGPRVVQAGREHRRGIVVSVGGSDIFVEFGPKELGVVARDAWKEDEQAPVVGEELQLVINRFDKDENIFLCSRPGSVQKAEWELLEPGQIVEARVTGKNKGGLELEVAGHRAFMPAGQVDIRHIDDLSVFVGEKMQAQVIRVDRGGKGNIVLSRREILAEERAKLAEELKTSLSEGQVLDGVVKKIMPFGAFVDIGGLDGLVHIADLSHDRIHLGEQNVQKFVKEGQQVRVQVLRIDWEKNRIALGMKQLAEDPFVSATEELVEGAIVTGKIKNIADFGAFAELPGGTEGLIHISELAWKRTNHPSEVVQPDQVVQVKVLKIDPDNRRISLSLKQAEERPKQEGGGKGRGGPGGPGGRGRGRGDRAERDHRTPDEILKETPHLRRLRAQSQQAGGGTGGLVRRSGDPLAEPQQPAPNAEGQAKHDRKKEPAKKRKQEDLPPVEGLDQLLNKFGGL